MKFLRYSFVFLALLGFFSVAMAQEEENSNMGIDCSQEQLLNGQCKFNIYDTLGIRQNSSQNEPAVFVQDAIFAATTFIGTVITIALIFSGLLFIRAGLSANE